MQRFRRKSTFHRLIFLRADGKLTKKPLQPLTNPTPPNKPTTNQPINKQREPQNQTKTTTTTKKKQTKKKPLQPVHHVTTGDTNQE